MKYNHFLFCNLISGVVGVYTLIPSTHAEQFYTPRINANWTVPECGIEMIWVNPGSFRMGSPNSEAEHCDDETIHQVTLTEGFWLGKYEITQKQWIAVTGDKNPAEISGDQLPAYCMSWEDASAFCHTLTEREKAARRLPQGYEYSLPTEAEWEYACRAETTSPFAGSGSLDEMGWYAGNSNCDGPRPVGQKQPNAWGIYDMHGNMMEWCIDGYANYPSGSVTDPVEQTTNRTYHVRRGGSWANDAVVCRSAFRYGVCGDRDDDSGIRVALRKCKREQNE